MPTQILAAGTTAASSVDVVVGSGTTVNLGLFRDDEAPIEAAAVCPIYRKDPGGKYGLTGLVLSGKDPNLVIIAQGTYQVRRPAGLKKATGIQKD